MRRVADVLAMALLLAAATGCGIGKLKKQAAAQEQEIADLRSLNETLTQQLTSARADAEKYQADLAKRRPAAPATSHAPSPASGHATALEPKRAELARALAKTGAAVTVRRGDIVISAPVTFESGKATLTANGRALLTKIGAVIQHDCPGYDVGVAGHTDSAGIAKAETKRRYTSNWELSAARALAAMHVLMDVAKINPTRIHFRGYGQYEPIARNTTAEGRAKNRRIEIHLEPPR